MKAIFFWLSFSMFFLTRLSAQNNWPPAYEIKTDSLFEHDLNHNYWQILEDKTGKLGIDQISQLATSGKFRDSLSWIKLTNTSARVYWFRYRYRNSMNSDAHISLDAASDQVDFYLSPSDGNWKHYASGFLYPWKRKDGLKTNNYVPITIGPSEELTLFQRIENKKSGLPELRQVDYVQTDKAIEKELTGYDQTYHTSMFYIKAIFFGVILCAAFFNFFFFLIAREKEYLYFSLILCSLFILNNPLFFEVFALNYPRITPFFNSAALLFLFFFFHFVIHYFHIDRLNPKLDKRLKVISFSTLFLVIVNGVGTADPDLMENNIILIIFYPTITLSIISLLYVIFFYLRKSGREHKLFIIAILPFLSLFGIAVFNLLIFGLFHLDNILSWSLIVTWFPLFLKCGILWMVLFFSWILFKRYDSQKKEIDKQLLDKERLAKEREIERNELIEFQKVELEKTVDKRTAQLEHSLEELKSTQGQLIQSEKMASLGELTAGIAHEIQNPLNFVNNFSEVNSELIDELQSELKSGNSDEAFFISRSIKENEQKISHHGKRADAIVKGMLQHSRSRSGIKEQININVLADEFLKLSYQGLRAREKSFNATIKTDFDQEIGNINIIPQDIGRVLLNLFNNSFYAVSEKKKELNYGYEPTVSVSTKKQNGKVEIRVKDNGNGIPQKILDKVFQPFFTTKPAGQGTGLGLSLSYDIIKAHGGEIKAETEVGEFTEFVIQIPLV